MNNDYRLIDPAVLLEAAGDSIEAFMHLLEVFLRVVPGMAQRLDAAIAAADLPGVAAEAHALKSCMAMIGAHDCAARIEAMERAARHGEHGGASAGWQALQATVGRVVDEARACESAYAGMTIPRTT